ncbi:MAG: hypothetical protein ABIH63_01960 [archaeon]
MKKEEENKEIMTEEEISQISPEIQKKLDEIKKTLEKFKEEVLKKYSKEIVGIELLPPEKEKKKSQEINILILIDDAEVQKVNKEALKTKMENSLNEMAKGIDKNIRPQPLFTSDLKEMCYDGKYDVLELIVTGALVYDKGMLSALKAAEVHKDMAIKKFEKYVISYVAAGSLFRGDSKPNDIDVYIIIDDTDVKKMSRAELKDKLRAIISDMGYTAGKIVGVEAQFHVQTYILTDFWDSIKDANPVIFTFLRDGVPLFDRGVFMPWKLLLEMGRIRPSPEAIDMNMDIGEKLIDRVKQKLLSVVGEDLFYAALNPAQAALMLYGIPPPTPKETVKLMEEIFVKKEKMLEKKYVNTLEKIRVMFKDVEHGKIKDVKGKEIDMLLNEVDEYLKRIKKLFVEIEKRSEVKNVEEIYDTCMMVTRDALRLETQEKLTDVEKAFKEKLVDEGKLPEKMLSILKDVTKAKKDFQAKKITKQEIEKINKEARLYIKVLIEFIQRNRGMELERAKIRFKYEDKFGEVLLLDKVAFITPNLENREEIQKAEVTEEGGLKEIKNSSQEEMEKELAKGQIPSRVFIKEKIFEDLRNLFGKKVEILINY